MVLPLHWLVAILVFLSGADPAPTTKINLTSTEPGCTNLSPTMPEKGTHQTASGRYGQACGPAVLIRRESSQDEIRLLTDYLVNIHNHFSSVYDVGCGDNTDFAMEVELKIVYDGSLVVKQARPWVRGNGQP